MLEVEVKNVIKRFGQVKALDSVSLDIREGEFFSILGPSGCGKTTLLRILAGLEFPTEGTISICGKDVTYVSAYARPTNLVFQNLALFPHMTVKQNVSFGLQMKKVPKDEIEKRVADAVDLVSLKGMEGRRPSQLSGGQQQRVAIARALVNQPKVLLFDEPLGALDLKLRLQLQIELKALQRKSGTTFVYVTHDQGEALTMSDHIAVMKDGLVCQIGTPYEIYSKPQNTFVANFIGDTNLLEGCVIDSQQDAKKGAIISVVKCRGDLNVQADAGEVFPVESKVFLSIRQELVKVGPKTKALDNHYEAKVRDIIFAGSVIKYTLQVGDAELVANIVNSADDHIYNVGDLVDVGWNHQDMLVLAK